MATFPPGTDSPTRSLRLAAGSGGSLFRDGGLFSGRLGRQLWGPGWGLCGDLLLGLPLFARSRFGGHLSLGFRFARGSQDRGGSGLRLARSSASGAALLQIHGSEIAPFLDGVGDDPRDQGHGPDGVVVTGDHVVDLVWVAVRVDDGDQGNAELVGLGDGDVLLLRV